MAGKKGLSGRKEGTPKTGGRKKGTPNKRTLDLLARFAAIDFDPVDLAVTLLRNSKKIPDGQKVAVLIRLAEFVYPKRKPNESPVEAKDQNVDRVYVSEWGSRKEVSDSQDE